MRSLFTYLLCLASLCLSTSVHAQSFKILHYTETSGFDHQTRQNSLVMMQDLGSKNGFTVDDDQTGAAFNSLSNLQQYAVVVFSNTSGDAILDSTQRANFEAYINAGGSLVGIHAASDTYRHSTANGTNTGAWDFYAETLGASVQQNPNHTASNHNGTMDHIGTHPTITNVPDPWNKVEEYYYWENGYLQSGNTIVLMVRSTGPNSYDDPRPMSWYKILPSGGRAFYTALGHANSNFTSDTAFQNHIRDAVLWAAKQGMSLAEGVLDANFQVFPNPVQKELNVAISEQVTDYSYTILGLSGQILQKGELKLSEGQGMINVEKIKPGYYLLRLEGGNTSYKFVKSFTKH